MPPSDSDNSSRPSSEGLLRAALESIGSLLLTVLLLVVLVGVLLWGTTVEKYYGDTAAKFGIYGSWWFNGIGALFAINSAAALILRWPWKRQQTGFILPHLGLIVLLVGCYVSRHYGMEATVSVIEGQSSDLAYKGASQHVELDGQQYSTLTSTSDEGGQKAADPITVRFTSGPFNWADYQATTSDETATALPMLPWSLAHRDRGVLYDRDGIRLEVLDYLSNSEIVDVPSLAVQATPLGPKGSEQSEDATMLHFEVKPADGPHIAGHIYGLGSEQQLTGGTRLLFWMTGSPEETAAFRQSSPEGPLGKLGQVVLFAKGKAHHWQLDDWKPGDSRPLGDSGLTVELKNVDSKKGEVDFSIHRGGTSRPMELSAEFPQLMTQQDFEHQVFGTYWRGAGEKSAVEPAAEKKAEAKAQPPSKPEAKPDSEPMPPAPPRIDVLQGADRQLYLRTWRDGKAETSGPIAVATDAGRTVAFAGTPSEVVLRFGDFHPADRPGAEARALKFDSSHDMPHLRQARVRLTVDGDEEEFWIPCMPHDPIEARGLAVPTNRQQKIVAGKGRQIALRFEPDAFRLGLAVHLRKAWRKLDPGSRQPSFYASEIDLVPNGDTAKDAAAEPPQKYENLLVTLNAPLDFTDPASGRSLRMFQSSMLGPFPPEDFGIKLGDQVYVSGLTLNYDPGRGLTYIGCLLVVAGIFVAYFVRFLNPSRSGK